MAGMTLTISGLKDFSRALKQVDNELPKALRMALNNAADAVLDRARPQVPSLSGRARRSLKPKSTRTLVRVSGGSKRVPYYPFLDFGGRVGRSHAVKRPFLKDGRYIYPAYFKLRDSGEFAEILEAELLSIARRAGLEIT